MKWNTWKQLFHAVKNIKPKYQKHCSVWLRYTCCCVAYKEGYLEGLREQSKRETERRIEFSKRHKTS